MARRRLSRIFITVMTGVMALFMSGCTNEGVNHIVTVNSFSGEVSIDRGQKLTAEEGLKLNVGDNIKVGSGASLELLGDSDKHISAEENTGFVVRSTGNDESGNIVISLSYGKVNVTIDDNNGSSVGVKTPNADLSLRGTAFSAAYNAEKKSTTVEALGGKVRLSADGNVSFIEEGESAEIKSDEGKVSITTAEMPDKPADEDISSVEADKLFTITVTYPDKEKPKTVSAGFNVKLSDYAAAETGVEDNDVELQKLIGMIKSHGGEVDDFFSANKDAASDSSKQQDITIWFANSTSIGSKKIHISKAVMTINADSNIVFELYGDLIVKADETTVPDSADEPEVTTVSENSGNPAVTTAPVSTTKVTTKETKKETTKESSTKSNAIKMVEIASGRIVYVDIPSGYKLWEYDASDYKKEGKLYGALLVPKKSGKYNVSISFESGDPMKSLIKNDKCDYDGLSYKVVDEYRCAINSSKKGTVYIAEVKEGSKSQGYIIFVQCVSGEDTYLVIQQEDADGNTMPISTSRLYGSTKDIKKFARELFPKS